MKLKCKHCGYEWNYGGSNKYYASCPHCLNKVKVGLGKSVKLILKDDGSYEIPIPNEFIKMKRWKDGEKLVLIENDDKMLVRKFRKGDNKKDIIILKENKHD